MYLGILLCLSGVGIAIQHSGFIVFVLATAVYLQRFQILPEERLLQAKFGQNYLTYKSKVARWF